MFCNIVCMNHTFWTWRKITHFWELQCWVIFECKCMHLLRGEMAVIYLVFSHFIFQKLLYFVLLTVLLYTNYVIKKKNYSEGKEGVFDPLLTCWTNCNLKGLLLVWGIIVAGDWDILCWSGLKTAFFQLLLKIGLTCLSPLGVSNPAG